MALLWAPAACSDGSSDPGPRRIAVVAGDAADPGFAHTVERVASLIAQVTGTPTPVVAAEGGIPAGTELVLALGRGALSERVLTAARLDSLAVNGYALASRDDGGHTLLAAAGRDLLGNGYAAYAALEALGFGFFHPEQPFVPDTIERPGAIDRDHAPSYSWRGFHVHTMHPIELMDSLLVASDEHLAEAERYLDWLVANRQTYLQWVLQDTVGMKSFLPHAARIVERAHALGLEVGIDAPFQFVQQNAWVLIPDASSPAEPQIEARIAELMTVPWDVINVELGAAEFLPTDDQATFDWMNFTAELLDRVYGVELLAKVHITTGQTAPAFGDINFNFLPGLADPRVGVMPHTVQFYDLFRVAPTYGNEDFSAMREFLLGEIGERRVLYYPETAYWVTFDVDVPLFLPHYVFARWNDLNRLAGSGMDGQIDFTSGFEWGYWLNDWAAASAAYDARADWRAILARFTRVFGRRAAAMQDLLERIIVEQGTELLEQNLIAEVIGWDTADDIGHLVVDTHFQPKRLLPADVRSLDAAGLDAYRRDVIEPLRALDATYAGFLAEIEGLGAGVPAAARSWWEELRDALEVTRWRVRHALRLDEGLAALREDELGLDPAGGERAPALWREAQDARRAAEPAVARREAAYRFPPERIARRRENPTSYEFGYLYTVWDLYYWKRDEARAFQTNFCICEGNLVNLADNLLGEGAIGTLLESLPAIPGCLDACVHPVEALAEPAVPDPAP